MHALDASPPGIAHLARKNVGPYVTGSAIVDGGRRKARHPVNAPPAPIQTDALLGEIEALGETLQTVRGAIGRVIFGQSDVIEQTPVTISTLSRLKAAICALKSCVPFWKRPGSVSVKPICASGLGKVRFTSTNRESVRPVLIAWF